MNLRKSSGSAHIALIIITVVGLIGALGFIFWNNLNQDSDVKTDSALVPEKKANEIKLLKACLETEKLCFDYPADWTVKIDTNPNRDFPGDNATVTSKDGFKILVHSGITGIGGTCDPDTQGTVVVVETKELSISGYGAGDQALYHSEKLHAAKIIRVNQQRNDFRPLLLLTTDLNLTTVGTVPGCDAAYAGLFEGKHTLTNASGDQYKGLISFGGSYSENEYDAPSSSEAEALKRLGSAQYNDAYKILTSVRYE